mmetsp:Transcript_17946/g.36444  ORF Transcript_17946/g.36444 Transcript_17946/m.36444 type:complete len:248 (-) Transcript_17946:27-770(-)
MLPTVISLSALFLPAIASSSPGLRGVVSPPLAHPACEALENYQAPYVQSNYSRAQHMGFYYELAFRDLYPAPPHSDCQSTTKFSVSDSEYDERFTFDVIEYGTTMRCSTLIAMTSTSSPLVVDQVMTATNISGHALPPLGSAKFHTTIVAFSESPGSGPDNQYEWVVEFTCGSSDSLAIPLLFPGGFVGINMYSKSAPHTDQGNLNLAEMLEAAEELGLAWATDSESWQGLDSGFNVVPHGPDCEYQ